MAENQESNIDVIENLALITDAMQTIFPEGKMICVYELKEDDFKKVQEYFRKIDHQHKRFSINISGLEHVFIHQEYINYEENESKESPELNKDKPEKVEEEVKVKKESKLKKILSWFISGGSSIK